MFAARPIKKAELQLISQETEQRKNLCDIETKYVEWVMTFAKGNNQKESVLSMRQQYGCVQFIALMVKIQRGL